LRRSALLAMATTDSRPTGDHLVREAGVLLSSPSLPSCRPALPRGRSIMVPARLVVRVALTVVGGMAALACGFADVFRPAGPEAVTITYVGDTILHRDSTVPFSVVVDARGTLLDRPHLTMWSSDTSVFDLTAG